jgi:Amt family ammonium transporter
MDNGVRHLAKSGGRFSFVGGTVAMIRISMLALGVWSVTVNSVWAQPTTGAATAINGADTAWVLLSSALVMAMVVPGLALFYGGLVRSKNVLGTIMQSIAILCLVSVLWMLAGYSLSFGPDVKGIIGSLEWAGLMGVGLEPHPTYGTTVPHQAFMVFQMMFAAITPALITGAFAERMKFSALLAFSGLWSVFVYAPVAHWLWGGGWLAQLGALDFAGGAVVHTSSGVSALVCVLVLGARHGYGTDYLAPHNMPMVLLGTGLLWLGWFGFNAGSALGPNQIAVAAFLATHTAAVAGGLAWIAIEWMHRGTPTVLGIASGIIAGLAIVTPGAGFVGPLAAFVMGFIGGSVSYLAIIKKGKFGFDDSLDVVGIHGVAGILGMTLAGVLASKTVNPGGADGLLAGNPGFLGVQILAVCVVALFSATVTYVILRLVDRLLGLRVTREEERAGLDISQHNERAYS